MSHVEELRQIHADINSVKFIVMIKESLLYKHCCNISLHYLQMENVIKKAEEARTRSLDRAKKIHEEYRPLKDDIDRMRRDYLGLERLPELHEQESDLITPESVCHNNFLSFLLDLHIKNISNKFFINITSYFMTFIYQY